MGAAVGTLPECDVIEGSSGGPNCALPIMRAEAMEMALQELLGWMCTVQKVLQRGSSAAAFSSNRNVEWPILCRGCTLAGWAPALLGSSRNEMPKG